MNVPSTHMESIEQLTKSIRRASKPRLGGKKYQERQINAAEIYEWKSWTKPEEKAYQEWVDSSLVSHSNGREFISSGYICKDKNRLLQNE